MIIQVISTGMLKTLVCLVFKIYIEIVNLLSDVPTMCLDHIHVRIAFTVLFSTKYVHFLHKKNYDDLKFFQDHQVLYIIM
jgi:hypothetical protein